MLNTLSGLYKSIGMQADEAFLKKRLSGIEGFTKNMEIDSIISVVKYLKQFDQKEFPEDLITRVKEKDASFDASESKNELKVLALAVCHVLFELRWKTIEADLMCLFCLSGLQSKRTVPHLSDLLISCENFLKKKIMNIRSEAASLNSLELSFPAKDVPAYDLAQLTNNFQNLSNVISDFGSVTEMLLDETNILWWVIGRYSHVASADFDSLDTNLLAVVAGKELAGLINVFPGPSSFRSILHEALVKRRGAEKRSTSKSLEASIKACTEKLRGVLVSDYLKSIGEYREELKTILPITFSFIHRQEFGSTAWKHQIKTIGDSKYLDIIDPVELSSRSYFEALALKAFVEYGETNA